MPRTVYAVSSGSYSDYSVHCIFERQEDAQAYINARNSNSEWHYGRFEIETFTMYNAGESPELWWRAMWDTMMNTAEPRVQQFWSEDVDIYSYTTGGTARVIPDKLSMHKWRTYWNAEHFRFECISKDEDRCKKIVADAAAQYIMENGIVFTPPDPNEDLSF